jgi:multidrug efflux pump subunit AcrA (membrane-fusion protein)
VEIIGMRPQHLHRSAIALLLTVVAPTVVMSAACSKKSDTNAAARVEPAVPVSLARVKTEAIQKEVEVVGTLWGDEDATIAAKVSGRIISFYKDVGDRAASGEMLVQIDPTDYGLAVKQKELAVREALAKIALKELPPAEYDPVQVPTVQRAKLVAANAESKFKRTKQLFEQQPPRVTVQDFDDAKTNWEVAQSAYDVELLNARSIIEEARTKQADLSMAQQNLTDAAVRAPAAALDPREMPRDRAAGEKPRDSAAGAGDGAAASPRTRSYAIAGRMGSVGEFVKEGAPLLRLVDDDRVKLRTPVPERYSNEIKVGQKVRVSVESSTQEFWGEVARINPQIDPANRTFEVEVGIPNPEHLLHPGAFVRARIQTRLDPAVVFVPQEALISFAGVNKVFTVEGDKAREIEITPGERKGDWIEAKKGLKGDESVVVSGNSKLATGVLVAVKADEHRATDPATPAASGAETANDAPQRAPSDASRAKSSRDEKHR